MTPTSVRHAAPAPLTASARATALEMKGIEVGYGRTTVLQDVSIAIPAGAIVALLGPNGAGKTTLLRTASGLLKPSRGSVSIDGADVTKLASNKRARKGLCLIPEGRGIFRSLTVRENLRLYLAAQGKASADQAREMFPVLGDRLNQVAGTMSGGQQQMLALARSYLSNPGVVLLDEVSMGLAPKVVDEIFAAIGRLAETGVALLLVEQYVTRALEMADQVVLLDRGHVAFTGKPSDLDEEAVLRGYLGGDALSGGDAEADRRRREAAAP